MSMAHTERSSETNKTIEINENLNQIVSETIRTFARNSLLIFPSFFPEIHVKHYYKARPLFRGDASCAISAGNKTKFTWTRAWARPHSRSGQMVTRRPQMSPWNTNTWNKDIITPGNTSAHGDGIITRYECSLSPTKTWPERTCSFNGVVKTAAMTKRVHATKFRPQHSPYIIIPFSLSSSQVKKSTLVI